LPLPTSLAEAVFVLKEAELQAFVPGIYPRSEALVQSTRDLDRGRTTPEANDEHVERDLAELVSVQQAADIDLLADGMLRWQDPFRPLVEASAGLEPGPMTRFLDTNTFWFAPRQTGGALRLKEPLTERYIAPLPAPRLVTLPSPWAFAKSTELTPKEIAEGVLKPQIEATDADLVVLSEPFLAREERPDLGTLAEALETLTGGPELAVQFTFGDARGVLEAGAVDLPVQAIGIDFYLTHASDVPEGLGGKRLLAGVIDARSSALEDPEEIAGFVAQLPVEEIALVPNGDLQFVSEQIARQKIQRLGAAKTAQAKEAVA
jgi:5-methyltetrahydropteroyltriglutamate--homocysteine methyltransferase